jgi:hypothetical protein
METYAGIDLHSSNNFIGAIGDQDKMLYGQRHANRCFNGIFKIYCDGMS